MDVSKLVCGSEAADDGRLQGSHILVRHTLPKGISCAAKGALARRRAAECRKHLGRVGSFVGVGRVRCWLWDGSSVRGMDTRRRRKMASREDEEGRRWKVFDGLPKSGRDRMAAQKAGPGIRR